MTQIDLSILKEFGFVETTYEGQDGVFLTQKTPVGDGKAQLVVEVLPDGRIQRTMVGEDDFGMIDSTACLDGPASILTPLGVEILASAFHRYTDQELVTLKEESD